MAVQTQIGFFKDIVDKTQIFSQQRNIDIQPVIPANFQNIDITSLKSGTGMKDSDDSSGVMHWNFHKWGDVDNVVGA